MVKGARISFMWQSVTKGKPKPAVAGGVGEEEKNMRKVGQINGSHLKFLLGSTEISAFPQHALV